MTWPYSSTPEAPPVTAAASQDTLYFAELFGCFQVRCRAEVGAIMPSLITHFRTQKTAALLAFLSFHRERRHSREVLADMFWPDVSVEASRASLSKAISALRTQLEPPGVLPGSVVVADRTSIGLNPASVGTDTARFESLLEQARAAEMSADPAQRVRVLPLLEEAAALYHATLLPGYYDAWIPPQQERLADRWRDALFRLARYSEAQGAALRGLAYARRALASSERSADSAAEETARLMEESWGNVAAESAGGSTRRESANRSVSGSSASPWSEWMPDGGSVATLSGVEGAVETVPVAAATSTPTMRPVVAPPALPLTRFYGRQEEMRRLSDWIFDPSVRLITLLGGGGTGKTRLAREVLARLGKGERDEAAPEVFAIDLSPVESAARLPAIVMHALGLLEAGTACTDSYTADDVRTCNIVQFLKEAPHGAVLLLDNFEHLLPNGGAWVEELLRRSPQTTCVVTSRVRLLVEGEQALPLEPLPVPTELSAANATETLPGALEDVLEKWPSIALFVDRARLVKPDFRLGTGNAPDIARLVTLLEGIPLALELAAARTQVFTPTQMAGQIAYKRFDLLTHRGRNIHDRHRSLRDTLAWSVALLPSDVRRSFARLSVFRGGWDAAAAEAVTGGETALDDLAFLCDASLVRSTVVRDPDDGEVLRFSLLETVREYAAECLEKDGGADEEADCRAHHAAHYAGFAAREGKRLQGAEQASGMVRLLRDEANIRAAQEGLLGSTVGTTAGGARLSLTFAESLTRFRLLRCEPGEGLRFLEAALARRGVLRGAAEKDDAALLLRAVNGAGILAMTMGEYGAARRYFRQAHFLLRGNGPVALAAPEMGLIARRRTAALNNLGTVANDAGRWHEARRFYSEGLRIAQDIGERSFEATLLANLGVVALEMGELDEAERQTEAGLRLSREREDMRGEGIGLRNLGEVRHRQGKVSEAEGLYRQSLRVLHGMGDRLGAALSLLHLSVLAAGEKTSSSGDMSGAETLWRTGAAFLAEQNVPMPTFLRTLSGAFGWNEKPSFQNGMLSLEAAVARTLAQNRFAAASRASTG